MPAERVVIVAADMATGYGRGIATCWQALLAGRSAAAPVTRFPTGSFVNHVAASVPEEALGPPGDSRAMRLLAPLLADLPPGAPLLLATTMAGIDRLEDAVIAGRPAGTDATPHALLRELTGNGMLISAACASSTTALALAANRIRTGDWDCACVAAVDVVTEFVYSGFSSLGAMTATVARPFDAGADGLMLGEAAAVAVLMARSRAEREGRPILGELCGWGLTSDATHMTAPAADGAGLATAVETALAGAGIDPAAVPAVIAHGTGTPYNDGMEIAAFQRVFGSAPRPVMSVKGGTGHTLAAAGLVEALLAIEARRTRRLAGTLNLREPVPAAAGWVGADPVDLPAEAPLLTTNSGFGGINAALVVGHGAPVAVAARPVGILGRGWVDRAAYGKGATETAYGDRATIGTIAREDDIFRQSIRYYGRFTDAARCLCIAGRLALDDTGVDAWPAATRAAIGVVHTDFEGCLRPNETYFADYVTHGRELGRSGLFVYTLPTSPPAEAAVHFGLHGPLFYAGFADRPLPRLIDLATHLIATGAADHLLVTAGDDDGCVALLLGPSAAAGSAPAGPRLAALIDRFSQSGTEEKA